MAQWNRRRAELQEAGIQLVMISVGLPEKGRFIAQHLELGDDADDILFVDPDNALYDALKLNRGVDRTFLNINTPKCFLDRFTKSNGMKDIWSVLSKYSKAMILPPKLDQGLLQGGTFVFQGNNTLFAHYDPSTAAHASLDTVVAVATRAIIAGN